MKLVRTSAILALLALGGCGDDDEAANTPAPQESRCVKPSKPAVAALQDSIRGQGALRDAQAVESDDETTIPGFERSGLYYLAAQLDDRVLVWGVSGDFLKNAGGLAVGVDDNTRQVSKAGDLINAEKVGLSMGSEDVAAALTCAR